MKVLPAIIPSSKQQMEEEFLKVSHFAELVQLDISDGIFTGVKTWPYYGRDLEYFEQLKNEEAGWPKWEDVDIELHLMVVHPENVVEDWIKTGVVSVIAHIEATTNFQKFIDICKEKGVGVGVAIKPSTNIDLLKPFVKQAHPVGDLDGSQSESVTNGVDFIQVMGSDLLGKHGVELEDKAIEMIKTLRSRYPDSIIAIDIGVTEQNAETLVNAGANKLISGGTILNSPDPIGVYKFLESLDFSVN